VRIEAVFVGSELLEGRLNTHAVELARRLAPLGLTLSRHVTVGDEEADIAAAVRQALEGSKAVLVLGGLGPTFDDLSREGVARALRRRLRFEPKLFEEIRLKFARRRLPMPPGNRRQAFVVEGGAAIRNHHGSAPGMRVDAGRGRRVYLLPGPEHEMIPMFEGRVLPELKKLARGGPLTRVEFHCAGIMESEADRRLRPILARYPKARFTILAGEAVVSFYATALRAADLKGLARRVRERLAGYIFAEGPGSLSAAVGKLLKKKKATLSVAESCTGGLLAKRLTDVPGSSDYFVGGLVGYANRLKTAELGVSPALLKKEGAVSPGCAEAMARGARRRYRADWAVSTTGIAGPGGGSKGKPVGTVYVGLANSAGTQVRHLSLTGDRDEVRRKAVNAALFWLWESLDYCRR
jgi:competence/damage-inducible protein CinA-like protein